MKPFDLHVAWQVSTVWSPEYVYDPVRSLLLLSVTQPRFVQVVAGAIAEEDGADAFADEGEGTAAEEEARTDEENAGGREEEVADLEAAAAEEETKVEEAMRVELVTGEEPRVNLYRFWEIQAGPKVSDHRYRRDMFVVKRDSPAG
jgi:hypothetical protein